MSSRRSKSPSSAQSIRSNDTNQNGAAPLLEDKLLQLQRNLSNANMMIKTKDSVIKLQGEQLKKMEDMYKQVLDKNEALNYANKKTCHDLENLKIILKQYENRRSAQSIEKEKESEEKISSENNSDKIAVTNQLKQLYEILKVQEKKLQDIMDAYKERNASENNNDDVIIMGEQMVQMKKLSTQISQLAKEAIQDTEDKHTMQNIIDTLVIEITDLRLQINNLRNVELSLALVDNICNESVRYVESINNPGSSKRMSTKEFIKSTQSFLREGERSSQFITVMHRSSQVNTVPMESQDEEIMYLQLDKKDEEIKTLKNRINELEALTSFDKGCLDSASVHLSCKSSHDAKLSHSEKLVAQYKEDNEHLEFATKELENQRVFLEKENEKLREQIKKYDNRQSKDYMAFKEALVEHTSHLKQISCSTMNLQSAQNQAIEMENAELREKVEELENLLQKTQTSKTTCMKNSMDNALKAKECTENEMNKLQDEIREMKDAFIGYKNDARKIEDQLRAENSNLREELGEIISKANTTSELEEKNKECECLIEIISNLKNEVDELKSDCDLYKNQFNECNRELEKLKIEHINKVKSLENVLDRMQSNKTKYESLFQTCERQKEIIENLRAEKMALNQECGYLKEQAYQQKEMHSSTQKSFNDFKKATEILRNCTRQEIFSLGCEVKHLQNMQNSCQKNMAANHSNNDMQFLINECNEYKAKLDNMAESIKIEQTSKEKYEHNTKLLQEENENLKCKLQVCSALIHNEEMQNFSCDNLECAVKELDSFMKFKERSISESLGQLKQAKSILDNLSQNKSSTSSDSECSLDCSKAMCLVQTNIQCLLTNLQKQNEEYGSCNQELQMREKMLDKKLCDIQDKKNSLYLCLTNINHSFDDSSKEDDCESTSMCVSSYKCPHK